MIGWEIRVKNSFDVVGEVKKESDHMKGRIEEVFILVV